MNRCKLIFIFLVAGLFAKAQDLHFSQFNENSSLINPALTGSSHVLKVSAVYKDQWRSVSTPYKTFGVSVESKFKPGNWDKVEGQSMTFTKNTFSLLAGGLSCYTDQAGDGKMSLTKINLSLASFVKITKNSRLSVGLQGSFVQRKIDFSKLVFSNQYTGSGYDAGLMSGEQTASQTFNYGLFSAGINWMYASQDNMIASNRQRKATIGLAFFNINQPQQYYLVNTNSKVPVKTIIHGDFLLGVPATNVAIAPSFIVQLQAPSKEMIAGTTLKYYINDDSKYTGIILRSSINFGGFYRYGDGLIFSVSFDKRQTYSIGFSYDVNVSGLSKGTQLRGGPEFTLRYNTANAYLYQKRAKAE